MCIALIGSLEYARNSTLSGKIADWVAVVGELHDLPEGKVSSTRNVDCSTLCAGRLIGAFFSIFRLVKNETPWEHLSKTVCQRLLNTTTARVLLKNHILYVLRYCNCIKKSDMNAMLQSRRQGTNTSSAIKKYRLQKWPSRKCRLECVQRVLSETGASITAEGKKIFKKINKDGTNIEAIAKLRATGPSQTPSMLAWTPKCTWSFGKQFTKVTIVIRKKNV